VLLLAVSGILPPQGRNRHLESPAGSRGRSPHQPAPKRLASGTELPSGDRGVLAPHRDLFACPVPLRVTQSGRWLTPAGNLPATSSSIAYFLALNHRSADLPYVLLGRQPSPPFPQFGMVPMHAIRARLDQFNANCYNPTPQDQGFLQTFE